MSGRWSGLFTLKVDTDFKGYKISGEATYNNAFTVGGESNGSSSSFSILGPAGDNAKIGVQHDLSTGRTYPRAGFQDESGEAWIGQNKDGYYVSGIQKSEDGSYSSFYHGPAESGMSSNVEYSKVNADGSVSKFKVVYDADGLGVAGEYTRTYENG